MVKELKSVSIGILPEMMRDWRNFLCSLMIPEIKRKKERNGNLKI